MIDTSRIYLLTPRLTDPDPFLPRLADALDAAPVACVRIRMGTDDETLLRRAADLIREVAHDRDVAVTLTDHYRLAAAHGLDGVHLENPRLTVREARKALGDDAIVGAFCGASRHQGMTAGEAGADYVSFGPVAPSALGDGQIAEDDLFAWWAEVIETPVVAEGGVTEDIARRLAPHADFFALDDAVWGAADPAEAIRRFAGILKE